MQQVKKGDFTQLPNQIMRDSRLTHADKVVYWCLTSFAWNGKKGVFPKTKTIAEVCRVSAKHVRTHVKRLSQCGYVKVEWRTGTSNLYHFPSDLPPIGEGSTPHKKRGKTPRNVGGGTATVGEGYTLNVRPKNTNLRIHKQSEEGKNSKLNHTKYDSTVEDRNTETEPIGGAPTEGASDPKVGSESTPTLVAERGQDSSFTLESCTDSFPDGSTPTEGVESTPTLVADTGQNSSSPLPRNGVAVQPPFAESKSVSPLGTVRSDSETNLSDAECVNDIDKLSQGDIARESGLAAWTRRG